MRRPKIDGMRVDQALPRLPASALMALALAAALTGCGYDFNGAMCGPAPGSGYVLQSRTTAQIPHEMGGSEAYQDHGGPSFAVTAAPPLNDTGGEAMPNFNGIPTQVQNPANFVIAPNGGERPWESLNSLPSPPCMAALGNG
jgi:hypothetical protein